jgi:hypothetical protein
MIGRPGAERKQRVSVANPTPNQAFSLLELVTVIAILLLMLGLLVPSISTFSSIAGRKGAVTTLMNVFEQARASALQSGANTYVVLWRREFPERDSLVVLRDPFDEEQAPNGYVQLTKWITLPKGIILRTIPSSLTTVGLPAGMSVDFSALPGNPSPSQLSLLKFTGSGTIAYPPLDLRLYLSEGVRDADGAEARIGATKKSSRLEQISFAKYTGRAQLDITEVPGQ